MNDKPLITVVVPVFNAESYLVACLDSLLAQSYPYYEVLVIDDGSTDGSATLIDTYPVRDSRIKVFHQQNSGVSASRNLAIANSLGDYLTFVDADDRVGADYLIHLLNETSPRGGRGVVIGGLVQIRPDGSRTEMEVPVVEYRSGELGKLFAEINLHHYWYAASKLYDLSLIREREIRFEEKLSYAEDALFLMNYLQGADYVRFCPLADYEYYLHSGASLSRCNRSFDAEYTVYRKMRDYLSLLKNRFPELPEVFSKIEQDISIYLIRALPALYRPPYVISRNRRLEVLGNLQERDFELLKTNYRPHRLVDKFGKVLLMNRSFKWFDCYMSILFGVRYRFVSKPGK